MTTTFSLKNTNFSFQEKASLTANYLLMLYAFFLPISTKFATNIFIAIAILTFLSGNIKEKFLNVIQNKFVISVLLFYLMHIVWMIGTDNTPTALFKLKEFKYLLYIIIIYMVLQKEFIYKILNSFMLAILLSEIISYCLLFEIRIPSFICNYRFLHEYAYETNVPFMDTYTVYSVSLSLVLGLIFYRLLTHQIKNYFIWIIYSLFFISASFNIFIVASRVGYILFSTTIMLTLFFVYRKQFLKVIVFSTLLITAGYTLAFHYSPYFKERATSAINDFKDSFNESYSTSGGRRIGYYAYGWEVFKENPLFGVGTGDHFKEVIKIIDQNETNPENKYALYIGYNSGHNGSFDSEYLDIAIQFGIIGLLLYFNILFQLIRYPQSDPQLKFIQYLLSLTMLITALLSIVFIPNQIGKVFILLSSLTLLTAPFPQEKSASTVNQT